MHQSRHYTDFKVERASVCKPSRLLMRNVRLLCKVGFSRGSRMFCEGREWQKMAKSNSGILCGKRLQNVRVGSGALQIVRERRFQFGGNFSKF